MSDIVPVMTAFFGGLAVLAGAFFKYMATREKAASEERKQQSDIFTDALNRLGKHIDSNTNAHKEVATATKKAASEAEKRNGHLAELAVENKKSNAEQYTAILTAISDMREQHVGVQQVDKQTVVKTQEEVR